MENVKTAGAAPDVAEADPATALLDPAAIRSDDNQGLVHSARATVVRIVKFVAKYVGAIISLSTVLDMISDLNASVQIMMNGYIYSLTAVVFILVLSWRFLLVFSALTPKPSVAKVALKYCSKLL